MAFLKKYWRILLSFVITVLIFYFLYFETLLSFKLIVVTLSDGVAKEIAEDTAEDMRSWFYYTLSILAVINFLILRKILGNFKSIILCLLVSSLLFFVLNSVLKVQKNEFIEANYREFHNQNDFTVHEIPEKDSAKLKNITDRFYRDISGILYVKTVANREVNGHLKDYEYFNGNIPQEIEPEFLTEIDDSFYYKDRKNIYLLFPTSGGERFLTLKNVDLNSFKTVKSLYNFGFDKNHFFVNNEIIEGYTPKNSEILKDEMGNAIKLISKKSEYVLGK